MYPACRLAGMYDIVMYRLILKKRCRDSADQHFNKKKLFILSLNVCTLGQQLGVIVNQSKISYHQNNKI